MKPGASEKPLLGARLEDSGTRFGAFVTSSNACWLRLFTREGAVLATHAMNRRGDGYFDVMVDGVGPGALYKFVVNDQELPDPYARYLPRGVHGPAMVIDSRHQWQHGPGIERPLAQQIIYELHVGTFTEEGTYDAAKRQLPYLAALGITTIEIMPIAAFPGTRGWGYDGVAHYAPYAPYGTPDDLRSFVDEAHQHGLGVILDVVYNHFGPDGNYLSSYSEAYFKKGETSWGTTPDFGREPMRRYVLDNARYWLTEFRFDGLRLDATHAIVDETPRHVLRELSEEVRTISPRKVLIAEDERNEPGCIRDWGFDAVWADDFHHAVRVTLTGERDGYYAGYAPGARGIADTIRRGWLYEGQPWPLSGKPRGKPADELGAASFVYCIQNHDQVGNRARGDRLSSAVSVDAYCASSILLLVLPMTPLLFMGQEWGASSPFVYFTDHEPELGKLVSKGRREEFKHFAAFSDPATRDALPDPQARSSFESSRLRWDERTTGDHERILGLYRQLIRLRRSDPVLSRAVRESLDVQAQDEVLSVSIHVEGDSRMVVVNFGAQPTRLDALPVSVRGWSRVLASNEANDSTVIAPQSAVLFAK